MSNINRNYNLKFFSIIIRKLFEKQKKFNLKYVYYHFIILNLNVVSVKYQYYLDKYLSSIQIIFSRYN